MPPALDVIVWAPCVNPTPLPLATALIVTPVVPANVPAVSAPEIVIALPFVAAFETVVADPQPRHALSKIIWPGTEIAGTVMVPPFAIAT